MNVADVEGVLVNVRCEEKRFVMGVVRRKVEGDVMEVWRRRRVRKVSCIVSFLCLVCGIVADVT